MRIKTIVGILIVFIVPTLFLSVYAESYIRLCLTKGQSIPNSTSPIYTCSHDLCIICVNSNYYPAAPYRCYELPGGCQTLGNSSIDSQPPVLTVYNPVMNGIYNKRNVLLDLKVNEESDIKYLDNIYGRGSWKRVCQECLSYNNSRSFKEGFNNITIKAEDIMGNPSFFDVFFFIDSKKPVIKKIEPKNNNFVNTEFRVTYSEENPEKVVLTYGNNLTGYRNVELNGCLGGKRESCSADVDLEDYDLQEIEFWFNITDIAGNSVKSRIGKVKVDVSAPVINYLNYNIDGRYVTFNISIEEENFDSVEYYDYNELNARWRTLCSSLRNGLCVKRKTFAYGEHNLDIQVSDKAGNAVGESISFVI